MGYWYKVSWNSLLLWLFLSILLMSVLMKFVANLKVFLYFSLRIRCLSRSYLFTCFGHHSLCIDTFPSSNSKLYVVPYFVMSLEFMSCFSPSKVFKMFVIISLYLLHIFKCFEKILCRNNANKTTIDIR